MEIDEAEASILREMGSKLLANYSFKEIAYWANEQGYKTAEGKLWYPITIRNTLRRVRYAGIREHRGHNSRQPGQQSSTLQPGSRCLGESMLGQNSVPSRSIPRMAS